MRNRHFGGVPLRWSFCGAAPVIPPFICGDPGLDAALSTALALAAVSRSPERAEVPSDVGAGAWLISCVSGLSASGVKVLAALSAFTPRVDAVHPLC